jgi:hypothetical protein
MWFRAAYRDVVEVGHLPGYPGILRFLAESIDTIRGMSSEFVSKVYATAYFQKAECLKQFCIKRRLIILRLSLLHSNSIFVRNQGSLKPADHPICENWKFQIV